MKVNLWQILIALAIVAILPASEVCSQEKQRSGQVWLDYTGGIKFNEKYAVDVDVGWYTLFPIKWTRGLLGKGANQHNEGGFRQVKVGD